LDHPPFRQFCDTAPFRVLSNGFLHLDLAPPGPPVGAGRRDNWPGSRPRFVSAISFGLLSLSDYATLIDLLLALFQSGKKQGRQME